MEDSTQNLPLLPLTSGVVLPGMVFTMALESDEAKAAAEAAEAAGGQFVLVPYIDGRYASVGVVAEVMETGELPGGMPAVAVPGRASGPAWAPPCPAPDRPCGSRSRSSRRARSTPRPSSWPASTGPCWRTSC